MILYAIIFGLDAAQNLAYQAACFRAAAPAGHTPRLHDRLAPSPAVPMGALVVDRVAGRPPRLPPDLPAIARALAAIHALPVPTAPLRAPLKAPADPLAAMLAEVETQAGFLDAAGLDPEARRLIDRERAAARADLRDLPDRVGPAPVTLISFDAHPGNFLITAEGKAVLVDLEKARYGAPGFDLAHATLYTSTTWDVAVQAVLTPAETAAVYADWLAAVPPALAAAARPWLLAQRRLMWLWSVTWCAKWRVQSAAAAIARKHAATGTEDWSADLSPDALIAHVRGRVDDYLDPATVAAVLTDWCCDNALTRLCGQVT